MRKGYLQIDGDAGDFTGSAMAGERVGMQGGTILIKGSAGERTGDRQRRGFILIDGDCGAYCAARMIAGTIAVAGRTGINPGAGMRRGTLLLQQMPTSMPATFNDNGRHDLSFVALLLDSFKTLDSSFAQLQGSPPVQRLVGDLACGGMGEILIISERK
jgi:formylmethanofuran dehydrogenase subunit C